MTLMADITSVEDLFTILMGEQDDVRDAKFRTGDALLYALTQRKAWGYKSNRALLEYVGGKMGRSKRSLDYRIKVARTYPPADRDIPVAWDVYRAAAGTDAPQLWLHYAADNSLSADKVRGLYAQVKGSDPNALDITWPLRNAEVVFDHMYRSQARGLQITFLVLDESKVDLDALEAASVGQLSFSVASEVVQEVAQEAAA